MRTQGHVMAMSTGKQSNIATANTSALFRYPTLGDAHITPKAMIEDNAADFAKGHEFATETYLTGWATGFSGEWAANSMLCAWLWAFGLGKVVKTGSGPYTYTATPLIPSADCADELPYFTGLSQSLDCGALVDDFLVHGLAVNSVSMSINMGASRTNCRLSASFVGTGKFLTPSSVSAPAVTSYATTLLLAQTAAITINGVAYTTTGKIRSITITWNNNLTPEYRPGSPAANGGQTAGQIRIGTRTVSVALEVEQFSGATEFTKVLNQTVGTGIIALTRDSNNGLQITLPQLTFADQAIGSAGVYRTQSVAVAPQYHASNGVIRVDVVTATDGICQ